MLTSNEKNIMIKHILVRRDKHLETLHCCEEDETKIEIWKKFYTRLLKKYGFSEVGSYV